MIVTRYWIAGTKILSSEGEIDADGNFISGLIKVFKGYHFSKKKKAFYFFLDISEKRIESIIKEIESVRQQL